MRGDIQDCLLNFAKSFDLPDWDLMEMTLCVRIYTDYSSFRGTPPQWMDREAYIQQRKKGLVHLRTSHLLSNLGFKLVGNQATCQCLFVIERYALEGPGHYHSYGKYQFGLVKEVDIWRINRIVQQVERSEGDRSLHGAFSQEG